MNYYSYVNYYDYWAFSPWLTVGFDWYYGGAKYGSYTSSLYYYASYIYKGPHAYWD